MRIRSVAELFPSCSFYLYKSPTKVWALAVSADGRTIVSGAADSVVNMWEDCTEEREVERENKRAESALKYVLFQPNSLRSFLRTYRCPS